MPKPQSFIRSGRVGDLAPPPAKPVLPVQETPPHRSDVSIAALPRRFRKGLAGTARDVQIREVSGKGFNAPQNDYLSFRLEVTDRDGNVVRQIPVELRAERIPGRVVRDGDRVAVLGKRSRRGFVKPSAVYVVDSQLEIRVKGGGGRGFFGIILALPLGLAFLLAWPALIIGIIATASGDRSAQEWGPALIVLSLVALVVYWAIYIRE